MTKKEEFLQGWTDEYWMDSTKEEFKSDLNEVRNDEIEKFVEWFNSQPQIIQYIDKSELQQYLKEKP